MEEMVVCASCGKKTFKKSFCLFCGERLDASKLDRNKMKPSEVLVPQETEALEGQLKELLELKNKFDSSWKKRKSRIKKELSSLEDSMKNSKQELKELDFLHSIEEIDAEDHEKKSEVIAKNIEQAKKTEIALRNEEMKIEDLYKKLVNHPRSRKKPRKINTKKVKEKLTKLVQAYDAKTISRSVYEKLKAKYEKELKNSRS